MKPLCAVVCSYDDGLKRTYEAITRDMRTVARVTVNSCGHGAHIAMEHMKKRVRISDAEWAYKIGRTIRQIQEGETALRRAVLGLQP